MDEIREWIRAAEELARMTRREINDLDAVNLAE
jgi:hypothetical protein